MYLQKIKNPGKCAFKPCASTQAMFVVNNEDIGIRYRCCGPHHAEVINDVLIQFDPDAVRQYFKEAGC